MSIKFVHKCWHFMCACDEQPLAADGKTRTKIQKIPDLMEEFVGLLEQQDLNALGAVGALKILLANVPGEYRFPAEKVTLELVGAVKSFDFRSTSILGSVGEGMTVLALWPQGSWPKFTRLNLVLWLEYNLTLFSAFYVCEGSAPFIVEKLNGVQSKIKSQPFKNQIFVMERDEANDPKGSKDKLETAIFAIAAATTDLVCEMIMFAKTSHSKDVSLDHLKRGFAKLDADLDWFANNGELPAGLEKYSALKELYQG